ncbi:sulfur reduction protein DsrE [Aestuariibaculum marinum]|uniref:Sulfur reduction protein DsrE n=1 Tax=Aestuariibaculum marinum TaxID=2683592 RepID=A0A8J6PZT5_9FLAO|nr:sulfur reduction protein DsrE [Aestuariibaculum marinum]MBD0822519.1 sulfur reduction protein DsrE [Aestuariibaculum marinum]
MKTPIHYITILGLVLLSTITLHAQHVNPEKHNYFILSKNIQQLKPITITAHALAEEDPKNHGELHVVFCGKTVRDIPGSAFFNQLLEDSKSAPIKIFVCGLSLKKFNVTPDNLPENIKVIDNGILYALQMKKQGFITLTI